MADRGDRADLANWANWAKVWKWDYSLTYSLSRLTCRDASTSKKTPCSKSHQKSSRCQNLLTGWHFLGGSHLNKTPCKYILVFYNVCNFRNCRFWCILVFPHVYVFIFLICHFGSLFLASPDAQEVMWVTYWLTDWSLADLTVVTLVSVDTFRWLYWWRWRWISWSWLSCDESYLVMKVMIVKEVITGDVSPVALFFPLGSLFHKEWVSIGFLSYANRCRKKFNAVL